VQDFFASPLSAREVRAACDGVHGEGRDVREPREPGPAIHRATHAPQEARTEGQVYLDLLGRRGLVRRRPCGRSWRRSPCFAARRRPGRARNPVGVAMPSVRHLFTAILMRRGRVRHPQRGGVMILVERKGSAYMQDRYDAQPRRAVRAAAADRGRAKMLLKEDISPPTSIGSFSCRPPPGDRTARLAFRSCRSATTPAPPRAADLATFQQAQAEYQSHRQFVVAPAWTSACCSRSPSQPGGVRRDPRRLVVEQQVSILARCGPAPRSSATRSRWHVDPEPAALQRLAQLEKMIDCRRTTAGRALPPAGVRHVPDQRLTRVQPAAFDLPEASRSWWAATTRVQQHQVRTVLPGEYAT